MLRPDTPLKVRRSRDTSATYQADAGGHPRQAKSKRPARRYTNADSHKLAGQSTLFIGSCQ